MLENIDIVIIQIMVPAIAAIVGGYIGGHIGGISTLKATEQANTHHREMEEKKEKDLIRSFLKAINSEMQSVFLFYKENAQNSIRSEKKCLLSTQGEKSYIYDFFFAPENLFTLYENNADLIGRIPEDQVRNQIVHIYTYAKIMITMLKEYTALHNLFNQYEDSLQFEYSGEENKKEYIVYRRYESILGMLALMTEQLEAMDQLLSGLFEQLQSNIESFLETF